MAEVVGREDKDDLSAHLLVEQGDAIALDRLLTSQPELLDSEDELGFLPVHNAARKNQLECLKVIIKHSPIGLKEVERPKPPTTNLSAIFLALERNSNNVVEYLLNQYSKPEISSSEFLKVFGDVSLKQNNDKISYDDIKVCEDFVRLFNYLSNESTSRDEKMHFTRLFNDMKAVYAPDDENSASINSLDQLSDTVQRAVESANQSSGFMEMFKSRYSGRYKDLLFNLASNDEYTLKMGVNFFSKYQAQHQLFAKEASRAK